MISETITEDCCLVNGGGIVRVCSNGNGNNSKGEEHELSEVQIKKAKVQKEMTMQDIFGDANELDDDEEDDMEWDPLREQVTISKWFCTNCTIVNFEGAVHCHKWYLIHELSYLHANDSHCKQACGEYKESGILEHGFFASPESLEANITVSTAKSVSSKEAPVSQLPASTNHTVVGFDERMLLHCEVEVKSHPHPERPDRLLAIIASLNTAGILPGKCHPITAREITHRELLKVKALVLIMCIIIMWQVHSLAHVEAVELTEQAISSYFTPDTYANKHSAQAARLAAGLCADLTSEIYNGRAKNGFALIRPPGHHAGVHQAMGFCLHNNAAIAALAAQAAGAKKVLIVDWDVHHGNGTQEIFDGSNSVLYVSLHRHECGRFYPGTGASYEVGVKGAEGYCVNIPWMRGGVGDKDYLFAFQYVVLPIALEFDPDFTIISAGFDAARGDPLGGCDVTPSSYARMTQMLSTLAGGKMLVILEGGYNLRSISSSATAVIKALLLIFTWFILKVLLGESTECCQDIGGPSGAAVQTVLEVLNIQSKYWKSLTANLTKLQSFWEAYLLQHPKQGTKKKKKSGRVPPWWSMCYRKRLLYHVMYGRQLPRRPWHTENGSSVI
ncbi:Histone deacetylase 15-like protein [Drosera capensis]